MTGILEYIKWEYIKKRRGDSRLVYQQMTLSSLVRRYKTHHSMAYQVPIANTDIYKCSLFPQTTGNWNAFPDSLIPSTEGVEDSVAKFTSQVRARD